MPRNSPTGFVCAFFATVMGFALIWHIWWMVILGGIGAFATFVVFAWRDHDEYVIPADEVARIDRVNLEERRDLVSMAGSADVDDRNRRPRARDPHHIGLVVEHPGPAPKRIVTAYGFWIFLLSDIVMFSCFFAAYAVLADQTAGGPKGAETVRPAERRDRDRLSAAVELHLRHGEHRRRCPQPVLVPDRDGRDLPARAQLSCHRVSTNSPISSRAAMDRRAAHSCPRSSRWSAATACMSRPASCGCSP